MKISQHLKIRLAAALLALVCAAAALAQTLDAAKLDLLFDRLLERNKGMGGLTVARDGKVIYSRSFGSRSKTVTALSLQQFPLGWFGHAVYGADTTRMEAGDRLLLSTDGVTEVFDANDNEFGLKRLESLLIASADVSLASVLAGILLDVRAYGQQTDDQRLLLIGTIPEEEVDS